MLLDRLSIQQASIAIPYLIHGKDETHETHSDLL
jgi:hypothetical protein